MSTLPGKKARNSRVLYIFMVEVEKIEIGKYYLSPEIIILSLAQYYGVDMMSDEMKEIL